MTTGLTIVLRCTHCGARVRLDEPTAGRLADEPDLAVPCRACGREFSAAGGAPPPGPAPAAEPAAGPMTGQPTWEGLEPETGPEVPFELMRVPAADAAPAPAGWAGLPARKKRQVVGLAVVGAALAALAWPAPAEQAHVVTAADAPPPPPAKVNPPPPPPPELDRLVVTVAEVPLNTRVTRDNLTRFFRVIPTKETPDKAVRAVADVLDKYAAKALGSNHIVSAGDFGAEPVVVKRPAPPPPPPAAVAPPPRSAVAHVVVIKDAAENVIAVQPFARAAGAIHQLPPADARPAAQTAGGR